MPRHPRGLTFPPKERARLGLDRSGGTRSGFVSEHRCCVTLPDGTSCAVEYRRTHARAHRFAFGSPLEQTCWRYDRLSGIGTDAVEKAAQQLASTAFGRAQREEQRRARLASPPPGSEAEKPGRDAPLRAKAAKERAGQYAVCLRFASGLLVPIGPPHEKPETAQAELASGRHAPVRLQEGQALVVGLCCRWQRGWTQPRFLPKPPAANRSEHENVPPDVE